MAELLGQADQDNFLWENESWSFPNLLGDVNINQENINGKNLVAEDGPTLAKEAAAKGKKRTATARKGGANAANAVTTTGGGPDHDLHIWTERERRKKMRNMFGNLHALLPHLPVKADKSTIVDEAVNFIKKMEQDLEKLEKQKLERLRGCKTSLKKPAIRSREAILADQPSTIMVHPMNPAPTFSGPPVFQTWTSPNVTLNVNGGDGHISICGTRKPGSLTTIFYVLEKYRLEVVSAQVSVDGNRCMHIFHTRANGMNGQSPVEEVYKQAAAEIMFVVA